MKRGFTLIELIIVIIIIGILATLAIPQYRTAVERTRGGKARHALGLIREAENLYRAENDTYLDVADGNFDAKLGSYIELVGIDADLDWDYSVTNSTTSTFDSTAKRNAGPNATETITLNQAGTWAGTFTP